MGKHDATSLPFGGAPTVVADANRLRNLIDEMQAPAQGDRMTTKMRADEFRALLHADAAHAAPPAAEASEVHDAPSAAEASEVHDAPAAEVSEVHDAPSAVEASEVHDAPATFEDAAVPKVEAPAVASAIVVTRTARPRVWLWLAAEMTAAVAAAALLLAHVAT